ncbi:MAG: hypothetical protein COW48_09320 [Hydrogenophilales bacterium CG17_big_fil_post_rev_8_21_14_2_50_63_12]|nr:MAG: hypothetical protein COW48_09320 [Hydrogenophilales bacterium CG17_big_fil_post_rev_8_21_14_2_50_63_12]
MVGVVDLDQAGVVEIVGVDNATVVFMVFAVQQDVDLMGECGDVFRVGRLARPVLAEGIEIPAGPRVQTLPESGELSPGEQAVELAVEKSVELGIIGGHLRGCGLHEAPSGQKGGRIVTAGIVLKNQ